MRGVSVYALRMEPKIIHTFKPWAALAVGLLMAGASLGQPTHSGTLKDIQGEVLLITPSGQRVARPGDQVSAQDKLHTSPGASAGLVLRDGTALTLGERAALEVKSFRYDSTTQEGNILLGLVEGTLRVVTGAIAKLQGNSVQVITKTSTIGARGTDFIVEARP